MESDLMRLIRLMQKSYREGKYPLCYDQAVVIIDDRGIKDVSLKCIGRASSIAAWCACLTGVEKTGYLKQERLAFGTRCAGWIFAHNKEVCGRDLVSGLTILPRITYEWGKIEEALSMVYSARKLFPKSSPLALMQGYLFLRSNYLTLANQIMHEAQSLALDEGNFLIVGDTFYNQGVIQKIIGEKGRAEALMDEAIHFYSLATNEPFWAEQRTASARNMIGSLYM